MSHPGDEALANLVDDDADPALREPALTAHVASCSACRARVDGLRAAALAVADVADGPSVVPAVLARIEQSEQSGRRPRRAMLAPALAAAAVCLAVLVPLATRDDMNMTPRGVGDRATRLALVVDGAPADAARPLSPVSSLRADLVHPSGDLPLVVVAVDGAGGVHWLRPAFTDAGHPPACPSPLPATELSLAPETVSFSLPPGPLAVRVLAVAGPCDVADLDARLSRGVVPEGARTLDEVTVEVRREVGP